MTSKIRLIVILISFILLLYASMIGEGSAFNLVIIGAFAIGIKECISLRNDEKNKKKKDK
ncbi:hypothetical protein [Paraclostridium sordellii]|uniref:hypothetical protein n=1 Tax=Paraclostridium sordellii TaxID=1505 RepID=UPI0022DFA1B9|nr:hypothetical protein [Paeniclostridium sordellii]